jgi:hypothetical protein
LVVFLFGKDGCGLARVRKRIAGSCDKVSLVNFERKIMQKLIASKRMLLVVTACFGLLLAGLVAQGCGNGDDGEEGSTGNGTTRAVTKTQPAGIAVDPGLKSKTGIPTEDEMTVLIDLQANVPYPVMVPTSLPPGYKMDKELKSFGGPSARDPIGYYNFRYGDPSDPYKTLTFNQSISNAKPLSAYYITVVNVNGIEFNVYWHRSRDYLPQGDPVPEAEVGDAETFVVVWRGQFTDAAGKPQEVWYQMSTGTNTGLVWDDVKAVLAGLKPLSQVGQ